jgi:hypothetical protein
MFLFAHNLRVLLGPRPQVPNREEAGIVLAGEVGDTRAEHLRVRLVRLDPLLEPVVGSFEVFQPFLYGSKLEDGLPDPRLGVPYVFFRLAQHDLWGTGFRYSEAFSVRSWTADRVLEFGAPERNWSRCCQRRGVGV